MRLLLIALSLILTACSPKKVEPLFSIKDYGFIPVNECTSSDGKARLSIKPLTHKELASCFEKDNPEEFERQLLEMHLRMYRIQASGFEPGKQYELYFDNGNTEGAFFGLFYGTEEGGLISVDQQKPLENILFNLDTNMPAERFRFLLLDIQILQSWVLVVKPNPIEYTWEDGAHIEATAVNPQNRVIPVIGSGFNPNETLQTVVTNFNEMRCEEIKCNEQGFFYHVIYPEELGKSSGECKVYYLRQSPPEACLKFRCGA